MLAIYEFLHMLGIMMIFASLGGLVHYAINGGTKAQNRQQKAVAATHGVGIVLVLLSGFGRLVRQGIYWPWPGWMFGKIIWRRRGPVPGPFGGVVLRKGRRLQTVWNAYTRIPICHHCKLQSALRTEAGEGASGYDDATTCGVART